MGTTLAEFRRRVLIGFPRSDGEAVLAVEEGINAAVKALVSLNDFDEMLTLDSTSASTVTDQQRYHLTTDLLLTRPKDIYSIRCMDEGDSRKLIYVSPRELDTKIPYPEQFGTGRPKWYTVFGLYIELFRIPDAAYDLYIRYSQWPDVMTDDTDECVLTHVDESIIMLAKDVANSYLNGEYLNIASKAMEYVKMGVKEERTRPDQDLYAKPYCAGGSLPLGEWWTNPFAREDP